MDEQRDEQGGRAARRGALAPLTEDECLDLLGRSEVGRIAWCASRGPVVLPVNIRLAGRTVLIRTTGISEMASMVDVERVAVQVDHLDVERREGWSVLARGLAEVRYDAPTADSPEPWPAGARSVEVRVAVDERTGRRLAAGG